LIFVDLYQKNRIGMAIAILINISAVIFLIVLFKVRSI
jgi:hypothetical protein